MAGIPSRVPAEWGSMFSAPEVLQITGLSLRISALATVISLLL